MLAKFRSAKEPEIDALKKASRAGALPEPLAIFRPSFAQALDHENRITVIAEYKRASPSLGLIRNDLEIEDVARGYAGAGASALSILTEETFFDGHLDYLHRARSASALPLLRKDFIFDPLQINATAATPASALLLIARMFKNPRELGSLCELASQLGIESIIEIFDENDLAMAREAGAKMIQVNARDLQTLHVDRDACLNLIRSAQPESHELWIAASGIQKPEHLRAAWDAGYKAALIGSSLMAGGSPRMNLQKLLEEAYAT